MGSQPVHRFNGNNDLAFNAVNWLASDEDLISILSKQREDRRITMTRAQLNWVRVTSQFILPLWAVVAGVRVVEASVKNILDLSELCPEKRHENSWLARPFVVFFILAGVLYWSDHHKPAEDTAKGSADTPPDILKLDASAITS